MRMTNSFTMTGMNTDYATPEGAAYLNEVYSNESLYWNDERLMQITRLHLVSRTSSTVWDVSYCFGIDVDGKPCCVDLPFDTLPRTVGIRSANDAIKEHATRDGVDAWRIGVLQNLSTILAVEEETDYWVDTVPMDPRGTPSGRCETFLKGGLR